MSEYWTYKCASWLSRMFPERFAYWAGLRISDRFYRHNRAGREGVIANLKTIYAARGVVPAEQALEGLARKTFQYFGKYLVDFFRYAQVTPRQVRERISMENLEYLDEAIGMDRGVILVTAHFGNWELGGAVLAALGYDISAVVLPERLQKLNSMFQRQREKRGIKLIPIGQSVAFSLVKLLKKKQIVAVLGDRDFTGKDDRVEFFGKPARIPRGPAWFSKRMGAPIVPAFLLRQVDDTFLLRCYPPIRPEEGGDVEAIRRKLCGVLEKEIGERPYQWFIFDDFWGDQAGFPDPEEGA